MSILYTTLVPALIGQVTLLAIDLHPSISGHGIPTGARLVVMSHEKLSISTLGVKVNWPWATVPLGAGQKPLATFASQPCIVTLDMVPRVDPASETILKICWVIL